MKETKRNTICELCGSDTDVLKNYKLQELKLVDTNIKSCKEVDRLAEKLDKTTRDYLRLEKAFEELLDEAHELRIECNCASGSFKQEWRNKAGLKPKEG